MADIAVPIGACSKVSVKAVLQAVWAGALAGAALPMVLTVPLALGLLVEGFPVHLTLLFGLFPLLVTLPITLLALVAIGLPTFALLERAKVGSHVIYVLTGGAVGFLLPLLFADLGSISTFISLLPTHQTTDLGWLGSFFGALSGAVAANVWWRSRPKPSVG